MDINEEDVQREEFRNILFDLALLDYSLADDENGIIILTKELNGKKITLIFHGRDGEIELSDSTKFEGINLLTQTNFNGKLTSYEAVVLES